MIRALKLSAAAVAASTVLVGCGTHPGSAAVVGDASISTGEVDDAARALCAANNAGAEQPTELPARAARQAALQFLVDGELSRQFAEDLGVSPDPSELSQTLAQNAEGIAALPAGVREDFETLLAGFQEAELALTEIGRQSLAEQGQAAPAPEQARAEGARLRTEWAADVEVDVDPRFGEYADGQLDPVSGSLSIPVSDTARAGAQLDPGTDWVAGLPASQKCA